MAGSEKRGIGVERGGAAVRVGRARERGRGQPRDAGADASVGTATRGAYRSGPDTGVARGRALLAAAVEARLPRLADPSLVRVRARAQLRGLSRGLGGASDDRAGRGDAEPRSERVHVSPQAP